ncbi:MAG: hypothetical protein IPH57_18680 [Saprospiraceae bacterium]|nr:hypothetical protein [Saprospiraceae bacterium]
MKIIFNIFILAVLLGILGCTGKNYKNSNEKIIGKTEENQNAEFENKDVSKNIGKDLSSVNKKKDQSLDTIKIPKDFYDDFPIHLDGKTYYPNFTLHIPKADQNQIISNINEKIALYIKSNDQKPIKWVYPLKESKLIENISLMKIKAGETSFNSIMGTIVNNKKNSHKWISWMGRQHGEVFINEISIFTLDENIENAKTEITVYDRDGSILATLIRDGIGSGTGVTKNKKYISMMWGGQFTEDIKLPSQGAIFDIEIKKNIWQKSSLEDCVGVGLFNNSNIIKIHIKKNCDLNNIDNTFILMDMEKNKYWEFVSLEKCEPGKVRILIDNDMFIYFNSKKSDKLIKNELFLNNDFKVINKLP